ncbi:MAG: DnaJ domain-containing protein [Candidatus Nitronauta litoralis]|uniref:DnaJ domain-containing protein n=1 Tax=Candidatus Nitronauta litoralis TaxID=2705533 RepID=A0A7T0BXB5_9BACT|nr:MAG: DnaJ domain-containing protein [Candidatus Nitronauta litoralis]
MTEKNHYQVLGVSPTAGYLEIKKAYRSLAKKLHPDRIPDPTEADQTRFAEVAQAYKVLSNLNLRRAYDATLNPPGQQPPPPYGNFYQRHYSGYPYFHWDFVTPHLHSFFVGSNTGGIPKEERNQKLLFNYKTLIISILGALFFFKFFTSLDGVVTKKNIEERFFNNISYTLVLKTEENKTSVKRVKMELYDRVNIDDKIQKPMFSITYRINEEEIPGPSIERIFMQIALIYAFITGGLFLLEMGGRKQFPTDPESGYHGKESDNGPDKP